jgi:hypothetical protein
MPMSNIGTDGRQPFTTRTIDEAGEIVEIIPESDIVFDQVRLAFSGNAQNFREVEILGNS